MTAPLYTQANFNCEGTGDILLWTVHSNSPTDPSNQDREIAVTTNNISVDMWSSVLTIRALPINDGMSIGCTVITFNPYDKKQMGATLTIEGVSPVNNLAFYSTLMISPMLMWSSPSFYSDDIPQGSITTYHVSVKRQDGSIIVYDNTTDTFYQLSSNFTDYCNSYNVSVIAFIEQYSSVATNAIIESTGSKIILIIYYYNILLHNQIILLTYIAMM